MKDALRHLRPSGKRGLFSALLAFVFLLQPFLHAAGARSALANGVDPTAVICASPGAIEHPTAPGEAPHKERCLLCVLQDVAPPLRIALTRAIASDDSETSDGPFPRALDDAPPILSGWSSSWSSQGPPFFS